MKRASGWTLAAIALAVAYVGVLWSTAPAMGYTRDEGYYFKAAEEYARWWGVLFSDRVLDAFTRDEIRKHFSYNTEHPPLVKFSQGLTYYLFHRWLGWVDPGQGFRIAGFLWAGLSVLSTYLLGRRLVGPAAGLLAGAALATLPRYFYDAHLACFDVAMTTMWTLSLWAFHRAWTAASKDVVRRSLGLGVVFGLALATKLNALFLPVVFVVLWFVAPPDPLRPKIIEGPGGGRDILLPPVPIPLVACVLIGPLVFVATWPYLWHDTFQGIGAYIRFHLRHEHYPISYFHELLVKPPFPVSFPFVMSALTIPGPWLVLGSIGVMQACLRALRRRLGSALLASATLLPILVIALPSSPIFGGVKHWYNAMPTLFIAGAAVLLPATHALRAYLHPALFKGGLIACLVLILGPGAAGVGASHPHGIGFYNALAGGFRGGAELGMQRGFWGGLAFEAFDALPERQRVFFNRTNYDSFRMYRREGLLPDGISYANDAKSAGAAVVFEQPEHGEAEAEVWSRMGYRPVAGTYQDGVTLTQIYVVGESNRPPKADSGSEGTEVRTRAPQAQR